MTSRKKLFLSYSHADEEFVGQLATALMSQGQDVWIAKWELSAGDSLVDRIFRDGLGEAAAVAVVLSKHSVLSAWVREEMSVALIRRIEDQTRVIPILKEDVEIPTALRHLLWVDMRNGIAEGVRTIINALHGISTKPPLGEVPAYLKSLSEPISGLSRVASTVGAYLLKLWPIDGAFARAARSSALAADLGLSALEVNDAVDELEFQGLAEVHREMGTSPYSFGSVEPTYLLHHAFAQALPYDPEADVRSVLAALTALGRASGPDLLARTSLSHGRLNRAVDYIKDNGYADVLLALGTAPFSFLEAAATRLTRQMTQSHI